ncbi:MAG: cytochrome (ubi)quinol oxidase subunit III [Alicyclobacillaceae bacterium]|nr:cytochrome (ubi)quinol oxidase subunit III [Alicyclobacillaceae bacterium]
MESQQTLVNATDRMQLGIETSTLEGRNKVLGFWVFLGGECALFASLFAIYLTLHGQTLHGPTAKELFNLPLIGLATLFLLTSSLTGVLGINAMHRGNRRSLLRWLGVTVLLGLAFLAVQVIEFITYAHEGFGFSTSPFSCAFYALVGFHGGHVAFGVMWISTLMLQLKKEGITARKAPKVFIASLYWHFVDVVWVFIFTVVYLMGIMGV